MRKIDLISLCFLLSIPYLIMLLLLMFEQFFISLGFSPEILFLLVICYFSSITPAIKQRFIASNQNSKNYLFQRIHKRLTTDCLGMSLLFIMAALIIAGVITAGTVLEGTIGELILYLFALSVLACLWIYDLISIWRRYKHLNP